MIGIYDIHTHFLPDVDDGAKNMEETREMLKLEYYDGVRKIYVTPHYRRQMFETDMEKIKRQFRLVQIEAEKVSKDLKISLGCEFYANLDMVEILKKQERPTMGKSQCVLTEFSNRWDFHGIKERCYELLSNGYYPIIAHVERYDSLYGNFDRLEELIDMGAYIQVNADSILGKNGFAIKRFCKKIMKQNLLHFVGSDGHNIIDRRPYMGKCATYMEKVMGKQYAEKILIKNPQELIEKVR